MKDAEHVKTFMASMDWFNLPLDKKKAFLKDKRLTLAEKTILECSMLLRENKFEQIISALSDLSIQNSFVDSQKFLVLGVAYNVSGNCSLAVDCFKKAITILKEQNLNSFEYTACLQLFFAHLNLKQKNEMVQVLDRMHEILSPDVKDRISYLRCRLNYHLFIDDYQNAKAQLKKLIEFKPQMHQGQLIYFLIDQFSFFLKTDQYQRCEQVLNELKGYRTYRTSENFVFMQALLNHYQHKKPIYISDTQFSKTPLLFFQIQVLKSLEAGNQARAQEFWLELNHLNGEVYRDFMDYAGDKCLFSLCLSMYRKNQKMNVSQFTANLSPLEKKFIHLLSETSLPLSKEEIYFKVYDRPYQDKEDLKKLTLLCVRIKKKTGLSIKSTKGCYLLEMDRPVKKVS